MSEQKKEYKLARAGQHVAVLNRYIKAGVHRIPGYQGAPDKEVEQLILNWEVTDDWIDEEKTQPFWFRTFGVGNMNDYDTEKSKKTELFESMFEDYDYNKRNAHTYLGKSCILIVKHNEGKGKHAGKTFANFGGVSMYPDIMPPLEYELAQPAVFFDFYNPDKAAWEQLKPFEQDFIKQAIDYPGSKLAKMLGDDMVDDDDDADF